MVYDLYENMQRVSRENTAVQLCRISSWKRRSLINTVPVVNSLRIYVLVRSRLSIVWGCSYQCLAVEVVLVCSVCAAKQQLQAVHEA